MLLSPSWCIELVFCFHRQISLAGCHFFLFMTRILITLWSVCAPSSGHIINHWEVLWQLVNITPKCFTQHMLSPSTWASFPSLMLCTLCSVLQKASQIDCLSFKSCPALLIDFKMILINPSSLKGWVTSHTDWGTWENMTSEGKREEDSLLNPSGAQRWSDSVTNQPKFLQSNLISRNMTSNTTGLSHEC